MSKIKSKLPNVKFTKTNRPCSKNLSRIVNCGGVTIEFIATDGNNVDDVIMLDDLESLFGTSGLSQWVRPTMLVDDLPDL